LLVITVGLIVGLILGLTGAGGSVFSVPLIVLLLAMPIEQAIGLSLGAVALTTIFGTVLRVRSGLIRWPIVVVFASLGAISSPVGLWLNRLLHPALILIGFSILVIIISIRLWKQSNARPESSSIVRGNLHPATVTANESHSGALPHIYKIKVALSALTTGLLSGLFGVGGGFIIVPVLIQVLAVPVHQAVASSLAIIAAISSSAFISFLMSNNSVDGVLLLKIALGGLMGMSSGIVLSKFLAGPLLQKIFAIAMNAMATLMLLEFFLKL